MRPPGATIVIGAAAGRAGGRRLRPWTALIAFALLAGLVVGGRTGALSPLQIVTRYAATLDAGAAADVAALLDDEPTIVTWTPALPRGSNSATMTLLDVGLADRVVVAEAYRLEQYHGYYQALRTSTELMGCRTRAPRGERQWALYDLWVDCRFRSTNELLDLVSGGQAALHGQVQFGLRDHEVRAVLIRAEPTRALDPVWSFLRWVYERHPAEFDHWMRGRFQDPVVTAEGGAALLGLAAQYAAEADR